MWVLLNADSFEGKGYGLVNSRTAVDKVGVLEQRSVTARFESMTGRHLFKACFCIRQPTGMRCRSEEHAGPVHERYG